MLFLSEDGDTFVVKEGGDAYEELGKNRLGQMSFASPANAGISPFVRSQTKLYRITDAP